MIRASEDTAKKQHRWLRVAKKATLCLFIACAIIIGVSYHVARRFLGRHQPSAQQERIIADRRNWLQNEHDALPVIIPTPQGHLAGLLCIRPHAQRVILGCHGYRRNKEDIWQLVEAFPKDTILLFDFRAHGQSSGTHTSIGLREADDVTNAVQFLKEQRLTKELPIVGIGLSMGAVALLGAAAQGTKFYAIIADSAYDNLDTQISRVFSKQSGLPNFPFLNICKQFFNRWHGAPLSAAYPQKWVNQSDIPKFFIHSELDNFTPYSCSQELCNSACGNKHIWITQIPGHAEQLKANPKLYAEAVEEFLK